MTPRVTKSGTNAGIGRRAVLLAGLATILTGCVQTVVAPDRAAGLSIRNVTVELDALGTYNVRGLPISRQQFAADLADSIDTALGPRRSRAGNTDLVVSVTRVLIKGPEMSLIAGGQSFIDARVTLRNASDGSVISGPKVFSGLSQKTRLGGVIGALSAPSAAQDYRDTVAGFCRMLNAAIFEGGARFT